MNQCWLLTGPVRRSCSKIWIKHEDVHLRTCIWKYRLQNGSQHAWYKCVNGVHILHLFWCVPMSVMSKTPHYNNNLYVAIYLSGIVLAASCYIIPRQCYIAHCEPMPRWQEEAYWGRAEYIYIVTWALNERLWSNQSNNIWLALGIFIHLK